MYVLRNQTLGIFNGMFCYWFRSKLFVAKAISRHQVAASKEKVKPIRRTACQADSNQSGHHFCLEAWELVSSAKIPISLGRSPDWSVFAWHICHSRCGPYLIKKMWHDAVVSVTDSAEPGSLKIWHMGLAMRKPISGVSDQAMLKPACSATETN